MYLAPNRNVKFVFVAQEFSGNMNVEVGHRVIEFFNFLNNHLEQIHPLIPPWYYYCGLALIPVSTLIYFLPVAPTTLSVLFIILALASFSMWLFKRKKTSSKPSEVKVSIKSYNSDAAGEEHDVRIITTGSSGSIEGRRTKQNIFSRRKRNPEDNEIVGENDSSLELGADLSSNSEVGNEYGRQSINRHPLDTGYFF